MSGKLSTHVLDLTLSKPAAGMNLELWRHDTAPTLLKTVATNGDGRVDAPLLEAIGLKPGTYELVFFVRSYFSSRKVECPFLDRVPIRFSITDASANYHV